MVLFLGFARRGALFGLCSSLWCLKIYKDDWHAFSSIRSYLSCCPESQVSVRCPKRVKEGWTCLYTVTDLLMVLAGTAGWTKRRKKILFINLNLKLSLFQKSASVVVNSWFNWQQSWGWIVARNARHGLCFTRLQGHKQAAVPRIYPPQSSS